MAVIHGGIEPERLGDLTFRQIDWIIQANRSRLDDEWEQTRLLAGILTGKNPKRIIRLSREALEKIDWTPELANELIRRMDGEHR